MKGLRLILAVCLGATYFYGARADVDGDAARAAVRRGTSTTTTSTPAQTRQKSVTSSTTSTTASTRDTSTVANRAVSTGTTTGIATQSRSAVNTSATSARENAVTSRGAATGSVVSRGATTTATPRTNAVTSNASRVAARTPTVAPQQRTAGGTARTATSVTNTARQSRAAANTTARVAITNATPRRTSATNTAARQSRAATTTGTIAPGNYKECRTVYYECMDEFCANKDTQLKRCACSARMSEFDGLKEQMTKIEDKLLDFNQRLLTVNMDAEDASAINTATEGELAFNQADKSDSKKMLDEISAKLNNTFNNSKLDNNLSAISLSLDMDSAFDNLDSMMGADTVAKSGTALYSAALPVCREMAAEVCSDDELAIAESGYQMMIEQDCNTVAKAYSTQAEVAREKIREGGALLDMSRLNIHQTRNSDDILTCKAKMLDMLSDTTVCGENLGKCLDTSGQYIDPTTGAAFLSDNLSQLATLITRPSADQTWTSAPGNDKFVTFLNSKKKFLAPAMENCQDIADAVWDAFIEDALAQIKLAQDAKLEDMRQSCTQLVAECMTDTAKSISEFDARALSIFGVTADKTVREMCSSVQTACTALLDSTSGGTDWGTGIDQIATDKSYETLLYTCREVGKNCIIQNCKSTSGNFGLCTDVNTSVNRKSIVSRRACWAEVRACINAAGDETLAKIMNSLTKSYNDGFYFYQTLYGATKDGTEIIPNPNPADPTGIATYANSGTAIQPYDTIFDICTNDCRKGQDYSAEACIECRLAERIWGNCEKDPTTDLPKNTDHNRIIPTLGTNNTDTLLSWFAQNTSTLGAETLNSCLDTTCGTGMTLHEGKCTPSTAISSTGEVCNASKFLINTDNADEEDAFTNCCIYDTNKDGNVNNNNKYARCGLGNPGAWLNMPTLTQTGYNSSPATEHTSKQCSSDDNCVYINGKHYTTHVAYEIDGVKYYLICVGGNNPTTTQCTAGEFFIMDDAGHVFSPKDMAMATKDTTTRTSVTNYYKTAETQCIYQYACDAMSDDGKCKQYKWKWSNNKEDSNANTCTGKVGDSAADVIHWTIKYGD